jgi:transcriptional regulator with XRE-family HTH domain
MPRTVSPLLPATDEILRQFGERLRLARLRRRLSAKQVAARAGMAPMTLRSLERGGSGVTIGAYVAVMQVLGVEKDLDLLVSADPVGRTLQDARLTTSQKPQQPQKPATNPPTRSRDSTRPSKTDQARPHARVENGGFTSARALMALLDKPAAARTRARR